MDEASENAYKTAMDMQEKAKVYIKEGNEEMSTALLNSGWVVLSFYPAAMDKFRAYVLATLEVNVAKAMDEAFPDQNTLGLMPPDMH